MNFKQYVEELTTLLQERPETGEYDHNCLLSFIKEYSYRGYSREHLEKWTDNMLSDKVDEPFFRHSIFDNYWVGEQQ